MFSVQPIARWVCFGAYPLLTSAAMQKRSKYSKYLMLLEHPTGVERVTVAFREQRTTRSASREIALRPIRVRKSNVVRRGHLRDSRPKAPARPREFGRSNRKTGLLRWRCSDPRHHELAAILDTSQAVSVVDVGGASGALVAALLMKNPLLKGINPLLKGITLERPDVVTRARAVVAARGLASRC